MILLPHLRACWAHRHVLPCPSESRGLYTDANNLPAWLSSWNIANGRYGCLLYHTVHVCADICSDAIISSAFLPFLEHLLCSCMSQGDG